MLLRRPGLAGDAMNRPDNFNIPPPRSMKNLVPELHEGRCGKRSAFGHPRRLRWQRGITAGLRGLGIY